MVTVLDAGNFEKETKDLCIVDFYADWCGPCRRMAPVFEEVSENYKGKVKFCKVNTENSPEIASRFSIMGIPCLIIIKNGEEIDRIVGLVSHEELKKRLDGILKKK